MSLILNISLVLLIIFSLSIIITHTLRRAVVLTAMLSILASLIYLLLAAPDIALAQAVIGSTLSTIILVIGIKKSNLFIIYYIKDDYGIEPELVGSIRKSLFPEDLDHQFIYTTDNKHYIKHNYNFDLLINEIGDKYELYLSDDNPISKLILEDLLEEYNEGLFIIKNIDDLRDEGE